MLSQGSRDWLVTSARYLLRLGPVMVLAGFAGALAIQWVSPETVETYLGDNGPGGGGGSDPGAVDQRAPAVRDTAGGGPAFGGDGHGAGGGAAFCCRGRGSVTFWGLARVMPKRAVAAFATATWGLAALGGLALLALNPLLAGGHSIFSDVTEKAGVGFDNDRDYRSVVLKDDVGLRSGVLDFDLLLGGGVVVLDYNGDGHQDIYVTSTEGTDSRKEGSRGHNALYRNNGDGTFTDVALSVGVATSPASAPEDALPTMTMTGIRTFSYPTGAPANSSRTTATEHLNDVTEYAGLGEPRCDLSNHGVRLGRL